MTRLSWLFVIALAFFMLYVVFTFVSFDQERYWAPFLPLLFMIFGAFFTVCGQRGKSLLVLLVSVCNLCMYSAGYVVNCLSPDMALIIPGIFYWIPPLNMLYH